MKKPVVMTLDEIRAQSTAFALTRDKSLGICALVDVLNMGLCRDGATRWYTFYNEDGDLAIFYRR